MLWISSHFHFFVPCKNVSHKTINKPMAQPKCNICTLAYLEVHKCLVEFIATTTTTTTNNHVNEVEWRRITACTHRTGTSHFHRRQEKESPDNSDQKILCWQHIHHRSQAVLSSKKPVLVTHTKIVLHFFCLLIFLFGFDSTLSVNSNHWTSYILHDYARRITVLGVFLSLFPFLFLCSLATVAISSHQWKQQTRKKKQRQQLHGFPNLLEIVNMIYCCCNWLLFRVFAMSTIAHCTSAQCFSLYIR